MTLIWKGLRAVWGTVLCIWMQFAWAVLIVVGFLMLTGVANGHGWGVTLLVMAPLYLVACWCSHHIVLMPGAGLITENRNPYLYSVASEQAQLVGLPVPKVIESPLFTASAIGRSPRYAILAVSPTLQDTLDRRELGAVLAHEMAHLRNRDALVMTVAVTAVGIILGVSMLAGFHGWIGAIVLPLFGMSWHREFRADKTAAHVCGDPIVLAGALDKLPGGGFLSSLVPPWTHPPTKLRVWCLKRLAKRST